MEINKRKSVRDELSKYCILANNNEFIEITEWANQEGWDIEIDEKKRFSLTHGELEAIVFLTKYLEIK